MDSTADATGVSGFPSLAVDSGPSLLAALIASSSDGLAVIGPDLVVRAANETFARQMRHPLVKMIGLPADQVIPGWSEQLERTCLQARETGVPVRVEAHSLGLQGPAAWESTVYPIHTPNGDLGAWLLVHRQVGADIEALQVERQRLYHVLDVLPAYVILLTPDYSVPFTNRYFRERFGEPHGRRCYEYLFGFSEPCENCESYTVLRTGQPHEWQWSGPDKRHYQIYDYPFTDTDGSTLILEMGNDITQRLQAEDQVRKLNTELEERVAERTQELTEANRRLRQEVVDRQRAQAEREDLLHGVSHDLRNPLAGILGHAQLLERRLERAQREGLTGNELKIVRSIVSATQRMNTMIQDLVDMARSEAGQLAIDHQPVHLGRFVSDLKERLAAGLETARISVQVPEGLPPVSADPARLERILTNLWSNAIKYGSPTAPVTVSARQEGNEVITSVADQGPGISPEDLPRLFQRYYRTHTALGRRESVGLGLYISRLLVQAHGGRIWAESKVGVGSTFSFSLPIVQDSRLPKS